MMTSRFFGRVGRVSIRKSKASAFLWWAVAAASGSVSLRAMILYGYTTLGRGGGVLCIVFF